MKTLLVIAMLIIMASTQTTITPKTQACVCSNLLNSLDCQALTGCTWTAANSTNSTNSTTSSTGTCANSTTNTTTPVVTIPTFCGSITNGTTCAGQVGCAFFNSTCQIFTGCTAYVKTTHSDCQLISTSCTTDGTRCSLPAACNTYTTQAICVGSQGSTTKNCKWTPTTGTTTGTCSDTICTDAPTTLATLAQCQAYISTCSSTGKGCVATLFSCTTYLTADGCSTRIGIDGKCIDTTPASANCRAQVCTDATSATATSCSTFLSSSTCLFNGKSCVASPLPACNTYTISQTCESMIGVEGKCTTDKNSTTNCKAFTCADAPTSTVTDLDCQKLASTCVTNGQGCVTSPLPQCSSYTGTTSLPCTSFRGINGICKASTTALCTDRTCTDDAAKTFTTDTQCDSYFKGCITKGVGCVTSRSSCENYTGTADECGKLIGTGGNCTFSTAGQAAGSNCKTKTCTDTATTTLKTNAECSAYSFQCASNNGNGCIEPGSCETLNKKELCQGKSTCSFNTICFDRSTCANYSTQTLCILNSQQYLPSLGTTYYERPCTWSTTCTNQICPTTASLTTDDACRAALAGCLTNGAGCVDIAADCTQYKGLLANCENFKGVNQTQQCTQEKTQTVATTACIPKTCVNAKKFNGAQTSGTNVCATFDKCYFDGVDNCTNLGCTTYFGTQDTCKNVANAVDGSNKKQYCWNTSVALATAQCAVRLCTDAPATTINDSSCADFLLGCVTNGKGCVDPSNACTTYVGGTIDTCQKFNSNGQQCTGVGTGTTSICIPRTCLDTVSTPNATNCPAYLSTCQFDGTGCVATDQCSSYNANGANDAAKATNCNALKDSAGVACGYVTGAAKCSARSCLDIFTKTNDAACKAYLPACYLSATTTCAATKTGACSTYDATGADDTAKAALCASHLDTTGAVCGFVTGAAKCSARSCLDVFTKTNDAACKAYLPACYLSAATTCAATKTGACESYNVATGTDAEKAAICNSHLDTAGVACGFVASATKCSARSCLDVFTKTDDAACKGYLSSCYLSATGVCTATKTAACSTYDATGTGDPAKATFCNSLLDTTGAVCGFKTGTKCSAKACDDIFTKTTDVLCKQYLPTCYLSGTDTCAATKTAACDTYTPTGTTDAEKATSCKQQLDTAGTACGYIASAAKCSAKSCTDVFTKTDDAACKGYLPNCYLSAATTCAVTKTGLCNTYTPIASASTNADKAASCKLQLDSSGNSCGYKSGANCSAKSCTDIITAANDAACKAYLPNCYFTATDTCAEVGAGACDTYTPTGADNTAKATFCNSQIDTTGKACGFQAGASKCSAKVCSDVSTANTDSLCNTYLSSCKLNANWNCKAKVCSDAQTTLKTDADCATFRKGCVTNGGGCLDSAIHNCADYKGDRAACQKFTGLDGPCTNTSSAGATSNCQLRQCSDNNNETSQAACDSWYPPLASGTKKCIWTGTTGCITLTTCDQINGTIDTCALVQASDSPCSGTATQLPSTTKCVSNKTICNKAPTSFTTDAQCKKWHKDCLSTGFGCISDSVDFCKAVVSPTLCSSYKKDQSCEVANQCLIKPASCINLLSAFECNNTILTGTTVTCGWNVAATTPTCISLTCELLPVTLTTDSACSAALTLPNISCTTNGAGCLTKTTCQGYTYASACNTASTTDSKKCIWSNSVCRNIVCSDNTTAKSDTECDTYLKGCRTTGTGCSSSFSCTAFLSAALCLKDASNNPCYWYRGACQQYTQCTDILQTTHSLCQQLSPLCTTDGTKCIAITGCSKTSLQVSCVVGTDGACGYLPASGTTAAVCAPYTNCAAATGGTTLAACQAWGLTCVSNGTSCIPQTACTGYSTEAACGNLGISGTSTQKCIFSSSACRPQVCTDATATTVTAIATHNGCAGFAATTLCTTNGTNGCIAQSTCSSYSQTLSAACVQGTDGPCFFQTTTTAATATTPASTTTVCRLKQCSDVLGTTSASCALAVIGIGSKCVSNGVNCIAQSTCSSYTARESCLGGGSDGNCAFTPGTNTTTPNVGTCQLFTSCTQANQDQTACNTKSASCLFTPAPTNGTSSCTPHNCTTRASGSTCQTVPNFDLSQYQICVLAVGTTTCQPGTPIAFPQSSCYAATLSTYTWNPTSGQCQSCQAVTTTNTTNTTNNTNNTYGYLVSLLITIALMI